jgi:hypothetical protein
MEGVSEGVGVDRWDPCLLKGVYVSARLLAPSWYPTTFEGTTLDVHGIHRVSLEWDIPLGLYDCHVFFGLTMGD